MDGRGCAVEVWGSSMSPFSAREREEAWQEMRFGILWFSPDWSAHPRDETSSLPRKNPETPDMRHFRIPISIAAPPPWLAPSAHRAQEFFFGFHASQIGVLRRRFPLKLATEFTLSLRTWFNLLSSAGGWELHRSWRILGGVRFWPMRCWLAVSPRWRPSYLPRMTPRASMGHGRRSFLTMAKTWPWCRCMTPAATKIMSWFPTALRPRAWRPLAMERFPPPTANTLPPLPNPIIPERTVSRTITRSSAPTRRGRR